MTEPSRGFSSSLLLLLGLCGVFGVASAQQQALAAPASPNQSAETKVTAASGQKLHRADFRVSGASCVTCLRRIGRTLREQKGVLNGDVSIFPPYWAVVIFDSNLTSMDKLLGSLVKENVKFEEVEDKPISELPMIVIPKSIGSSSGGGKSKTAEPASSGAAH